MRYPRVLHLGIRPIGAATNSGLTLGSMFGEWPQDSLLQLCGRCYEGDPDRNVVLTPPSVAPAEGMVRAVLGRSLRPGVTDGLNNAVSRAGRSVPFRLRVRLFASAANDIGPIHLPRHLVRTAEAFRPDVIHTLLGGVRAMKLAAALARRLDVPVVPHFMDDWMETLFIDGQLLGMARRSVGRGINEVLAHAPLTLAIGEDMAEEYARTLGRPCVVVGNSIDVCDYSKLVAERGPADSPLRLRYAGGLHLGRDVVIGAIARALERRRFEGRRWILELFVPRGDIPLAEELAGRFASIEYSGAVSPEAVPQVLVDADALAFVESTDPQISRFTRLSVSTKVPQYLGSGRPVLVVGPPDQSSVRTFQRSGVGYFAGNGMDSVVLSRALDGIELSTELRSGLPLTEAKAAWLTPRFGLESTQERLRSGLAFAAWGAA